MPSDRQGHSRLLWYAIPNNSQYCVSVLALILAIRLSSLTSFPSYLKLSYRRSEETRRNGFSLTIAFVVYGPQWKLFVFSSSLVVIVEERVVTASELDGIFSTLNGKLQAAKYLRQWITKISSHDENNRGCLRNVLQSSTRAFIQQPTKARQRLQEGIMTNVEPLSFQLNFPTTPPLVFRLSHLGCHSQMLVVFEMDVSIRSPRGSMLAVTDLYSAPQHNLLSLFQKQNNCMRKKVTSCEVWCELSTERPSIHQDNQAQHGWHPASNPSWRAAQRSSYHLKSCLSLF